LMRDQPTHHHPSGRHARIVACAVSAAAHHPSNHSPGSSRDSCSAPGRGSAIGLVSECMPPRRRREDAEPRRDPALSLQHVAVAAAMMVRVADRGAAPAAEAPPAKTMELV